MGRAHLGDVLPKSFEFSFEFSRDLFNSVVSYESYDRVVSTMS